ncbi:UNVERIFIED_ORG: hypothetical protein J2W66_004487 [Agrobacterium larrymoorei]|uniref:ATP-grasp domain-containing protein n=1 Tax=Agrobacterium cavarae TaxID=2528239 RepID=A0ABY1YD43_9HYPH|nr:peptide ligase PGM1-related protein [Agrobacterium cavarae]MDP9573984.1 hypothetical protein [Agrobacterium larrymoorei]TBN18459.1 hypothetical protein EYC79_02005 [Agrobacterium cavarae]
MKILIANGFSDNLRASEDWPGWWVQRVIWFASDGDILILPSAADRSFMDYATKLIGVDLESLSILILPPQVVGDRRVPFVERLTNADFKVALSTAMAGRNVHEIFALWPDAALADFARSIDASDAMPGLSFLSQDGGRLVNSKSVFRAIAAGLRVPIPDGAVCQSHQELHKAIKSLFDISDTVIVKQDYMTGGAGNVIFTSGQTFDPVGARAVVQTPTDYSVAEYVEAHWEELCGRRGDRVVVERYHRDSRAAFAEFSIQEGSVTLGGTGELLSAPFACAQVMPPVGFEGDAMALIESNGMRLAECMATLGFRGRLSADAIVTPQGEVFFTEYNGRVTGSTHIYAIIGDRIIGSGFGHDRIILERIWPDGWRVGSFGAARDSVFEAGLAFDPNTRTGVVFTNAYNAQSQGVMYCIAAPDILSARQIERHLAELFAVDTNARLPPLPIEGFE